jgi:hypothetical protein
MTLLDKIKLIDFYLHGMDRDVRKDEGDFEKEAYYACKSELGENVYYHTSLDAIRPVIVKFETEIITAELIDYVMTMRNNIMGYLYGALDFTPVFDSVVDCIKYLNEKEK